MSKELSQAAENGAEVLAAQAANFLSLPEAEREAVLAAMQEEVMSQLHGYNDN